MPTELRIGYLSTVYHTSLLLMGTGRLEKHFEIRPSWELFGGGPPIVEALAEGKLDLGYIGLPPVLIGIDRGAGIKCVAGGHMEGTVLVGAPGTKAVDELDGDLTATLAQFEGQTVGVPPKGSIHDIIVGDLIDRLGFGDRIGVKNYKWPDLIVMDMERGHLQVAAGTPALATAAAQDARARVIIPAARLWPNNPSYGIVFRSEMIEKAPCLVSRFLEAHRQAVALLKENPHEAARIVARVVGLVDEEFVLKTSSLSPKYDAVITPEFVESTMAFVPVLRRLKYITGWPAAEDVFDMRFSCRAPALRGDKRNLIHR